MSRLSFREFFSTACGDCREPYPYQERLALESPFPELLDVPTGLGKTAAAILAWLWRRRFHDQKDVRSQTPRRLVYCLPMRVLVEQTFAEAVRWLDRLGLLAGAVTWDDKRTKQGLESYRPQADDDRPLALWAEGAQGLDPTVESSRVAIHLLMGGEDRTDWTTWPERDGILIGTQDMILSRALNRGYASGRARWPIEFALLNNDCQWVMDEVQSMGSGLITTAQIDAFGKRLWHQHLRCSRLWMSATLGERFLATRDRRDWDLGSADKLSLAGDDMTRQEVVRRLKATKSIEMIQHSPKAATVLNEHQPGRLSLVVLNTVPAARMVYGELVEEAAKRRRKKAGPVPDIWLLHGRFRPTDRDRWMRLVNGFVANLDRETGAVANSTGAIIVSTQVIEAGLDLSGARLWSEIPPWPSAIQRLGRLNRDGLQLDARAMFWMPKEDKLRENQKDSPNAKRIGPYDKAALEISRKLLRSVIDGMGGGASYRETLDQAIRTADGQKSLDVEADAVIRPDDFYQLFSTDPDLAGGFTNISQFVRDSDRNVDVRVYWREFPISGVPNPAEPQPRRNELCAVPYYDLRRFLSDHGLSWEWSHEASAWERRRSGDIQPGMTLLLPRSAGGYSDELGWTGRAQDKPTIDSRDGDPDDGLGRDPESAGPKWVPLADHLADVETEVQEIVTPLGLAETSYGDALLASAHWHDWGKSLDRWQAAVSKHIGRVKTKLIKMQDDPEAARFRVRVNAWLKHIEPPNCAETLWAKFPDIRDAWADCSLQMEERKELSKRLRTPFSPGLRHEAASALAAFEAWNNHRGSLSALAVYLIASHHGKCRTNLRSTNDDDEVFGLSREDILRPVPAFFPGQASISFSPKHTGASGDWDESHTHFYLRAPSWSQVVAELLGPVENSGNGQGDAIPDNEPRSIGPFMLAYLEAVLRAADVRASRSPGKGGAR